MKIAKLIVMITSFLLVMLGVAIAGVGTYVIQFGSDLSAIVPTYTAWVAIIVGFVLFVVGAMSCWAASNFGRTWAKLMLVCYGLLLLLTLAVEGAAAGILLITRNEIASCRVDAYGTGGCLDERQLLRNFDNTTRSQCCDARESAQCAWVKDILTDDNCDNPELFKAALWANVVGKVQPVAIFLIVVAAVELITLCSVCWLVIAHDDHQIAPVAPGHTESGFMAGMDKHTSSDGIPVKSRAILLIVNCLLLVLGTSVAGFCIYIWKFANDFSVILPTSTVIIGAIAGGSIAFLAVLGCVGACHWDKKWAKALLCCYDIALLVLILVEIIAAFLMFSAVSSVDACKQSSFGSDECQDATQALENWVNDTRNMCCNNREDPGCTWASSVLTDSTCESFGSFKTALIAYVQSKIIPIGIVTIAIALIQLLTFYSTCCLIRAKGKALISGNPGHFYHKPEQSFYYGHNYNASNDATHAQPAHHQEVYNQPHQASQAHMWAAATAPDGRIYYYHKVTRETSWDKPAGWVELV